MDTGDPDGLFGKCFAGKSGAGDIHFAVDAKWQIELGDLIVFHQVRVKVTFPVEFAETGNFAIHEQTGFDCRADGFFVGNREGAGVAEADRAGEGVGFSAEFVGAGAEHFAGGADLDMHFQTDNGFVFHLRCEILCWMIFLH